VAIIYTESHASAARTKNAATTISDHFHAKGFISAHPAVRNGHYCFLSISPKSCSLNSPPTANLFLPCPKVLRLIFRRNRTLFAKVSRLINQLISDFYSYATGRTIRFGMIAAHQTFGDMLRWNPHFHCIVLEGGFDQNGKFLYIPFSDLSRAS
jgi:hypothetical protein